MRSKQEIKQVLKEEQKKWNKLTGWPDGDTAGLIDGWIEALKWVLSGDTKECKHKNAYYFHENAPAFCPDCDKYIDGKLVNNK